MNNRSVQSGIIRLFLLLVLCVDLYTLLGKDRHYHPYIAGDWLINYQGGFVRRGLSGEIIFQIAGLTGAAPWMLVYLVQAALYIGIVLLVMRKTRDGVNIFGLLFILSPLTFLFEIYDPGGLGRKELLFLFLLGLNGYFLGSRPEKIGSAAYLSVITAAGALAILMHELVLFYFPIVLLQLLAHGKLEYRKLIAPASVWAIVACIVLANKGGAQQVYSILTSWLPYTGSLISACEKLDFGAICYLKTSTDEAFHRAMVPGVAQAAIIHVVAVVAYGALFTAAAYSVIAANDRKRMLVHLALAVLLFAPLYFLGIDYGRWTHIFVTGLFLALPDHALNSPVMRSANARLYKISVVLLVLLSLSWNVIHTRSETIGAGIWSYRAEFMDSTPFKQ